MPEYVTPQSNQYDLPSLKEKTDLVFHKELGEDGRGMTFWYMSDLHLDFKLIHERIDPSDKAAVREYVARLIDEQLTVGADENQYREYFNELLICGDISPDVSISCIFLEEIRKAQYYARIYFVPGNHEYWFLKDGKLNPKRLSVEEITEYYRAFCRRNEIVFLQGDLVLVSFKPTMITGKAIRLLKIEELKELCSDASAVILGGTGFSGKNPSFNASREIYRETISSFEEDCRRSAQFEELYEKVNEALGNDPRVIVMTHNPPWDWTDKPLNPNWIHVFGHTHKNIYEFSKDRKLIADNQWGYEGIQPRIKKFSFDTRRDIFQDLDDGIYEITCEKYELFYRARGLEMNCNLEGQYYVLKREGFYFFMLKEAGSEKLYYLSGGRKRKCMRQSLYYYYGNMLTVGLGIVDSLSGFMNYMNGIASSVKEIGGDGYIHGCIVDIDFYNHIYVNPFDLSVTAYNAPIDMVTKYVYRNVPSLLNDQLPKLFENYQRLLLETAHSSLTVLGDGNEIDTNTELYTSTDIYKASRQVRKLQYSWNESIIREWVIKPENENRDVDIGLEIVKLETSAKEPSSLKSVYDFDPDSYKNRAWLCNTASISFYNSYPNLPPWGTVVQKMIASVEEKNQYAFEPNESVIQKMHDIVKTTWEDLMSKELHAANIMLDDLLSDDYQAKLQERMKSKGSEKIFRTAEHKGSIVVKTCHMTVRLDEEKMHYQEYLTAGSYSVQPTVFIESMADFVADLWKIMETVRLKNGLSERQECAVPYSLLIESSKIWLVNRVHQETFSKIECRIREFIERFMDHTNRILNRSFKIAADL